LENNYILLNKITTITVYGVKDEPLYVKVANKKHVGFEFNAKTKVNFYFN
jgi:hypothetical protein